MICYLATDMGTSLQRHHLSVSSVQCAVDEEAQLPLLSSSFSQAQGLLCAGEDGTWQP